MPDDPKIEYSQEKRLLKINTSSSMDLLLERFNGTESLSRPFEFKLTLLCTEHDVDMKSLLRTPATVTVFMADSSERYFHGIFRSFTMAKEGNDVMAEREKTGVSNPSRELTLYEAVMVPQVWFLSLDSDCRIFQNMSTQDIVEKVLKEKGVTDFSFRLNGTYPTRDYCVQYRESTLAFVSRLLEEEGIFYFFEHTDTKHTMVFADKSSLLPACPGQETAQYSSTNTGWVEEGVEGVATLERIEVAYTGQAALTDYNFETPSLNLMAKLTGSNEESYDYPGEYGTKSDGDRYVRIRLEEREASQFVVNGSSRCRAFRPGVKFKLEDHFRDDTNQDYFLTAVTHTAFDSTYRQGKDKSHDYTNEFRAIPKTVPYRPPCLTQRPIISGMQSAVVVGPSGEEIWVDKYGRVKVQFFWDRLGKKNENSSCWCRVSQVWAGKNWGWMTIPRIGQEVLIDFLEGNPDQPIIVGRVYNADQMPPYTLPDNQTQSGIKSRSSKGGGTEDFNEIRFEDKKGSEQLFIQAQKDMSTTVEHDDTQHVMNDRVINVDGKHTETIVKDTAITITQGNHTFTMNQGNSTIQLDKGNESTTLSMGNQSTSLKMGNQDTTLDMGNQSTKASLGQISFEAMQSITLTVGGSSITVDQMGVTIKGMMISIEGEAMSTVKGDGLLILKGGLTMIN